MAETAVDGNLYSVAQAADVLKIRENTLRIWITDRRVPSVKLGFNRFIPSRLFLYHYREALLDPDTRESTIAYLNEKAAQYGKTPFVFEADREIVR